MPKPDPVPQAPERVSPRPLQQTTEITFQGPLPHPQHFAQYESTVPGAANRILTMVEEEARERRNRETYVVRADAWRAMLGVFLSHIAYAGTVGAGVLLIWFGMPIEGLVALVTSAVIIIAPKLFLEWLKSRSQQTDTKQ